ncbi:MAG: amidohydrolase family protein [Patescibacteria group bacterium]
MENITITKPVDHHFHARQGDVHGFLVPLISSMYRGAVLMGNTLPPIVTGEDAFKYFCNIRKYTTSDFYPLLTIMLVNRTTPEIVEKAHEKYGVWGLKLIPGGASTNSDAGHNPNAGVSLYDLLGYYPVLEMCQKIGMPFSAHWELTTESDGTPIPEIKRETQAIPFLQDVIKKFPKLQIVVEHVTTVEMVQLVCDAPPNVTATITGHHPFIQYSQVCDEDGVIINPGLYCKPVAKTRRDMLAIRKVMFGGYSKFNFGSDCAWHPAASKKLAVDNAGKNPNAGIFNPFSLQILVHEFMKAGVEEKILEKFLTNNSRVYNLRPPERVDKKITLVRKSWTLPTNYNGTPIFMGGQTIDWQIEGWNWQDYLK